MIWIILIPLSWIVVTLLLRGLSNALYRAEPEPPESWESIRARLTFENRCDTLGRRYFNTVDQPKGDSR